MATPRERNTILDLAHANFPSFLRQREKVRKINMWMKGEQNFITETVQNDEQPMSGAVYRPAETRAEFDDLTTRAPSNWASLVVKSVAQTAYVDGLRVPNVDDPQVWQSWQENRLDSRQIPLTRATVAHGIAFMTVMPGRIPLLAGMKAVARPVSAYRMAAFYDEDGDEWPRFAFRATPQDPNPLLERFRTWSVECYDEKAKHFISCENDGLEREDWTYISDEPHPYGVPPVVRYDNSPDLEGHSPGEIMPIIPLLRRLDQDLFDRLVTQRYGAWAVRYIAGMAAPETNEERRAQAIVLGQSDILIAGDVDTKFGTLPGTDVGQYVGATDHDLRILSAITQTPPHHLLGLSSNLQAEALAAAEAGLSRKSTDLKYGMGESHEQTSRLMAFTNGFTAEANAFDMEVRWRDTESRSFAQTVQALGIAATQLKVPIEMLWASIPGWTDQEVEAAKRKVEDGTFERLIAELTAGGVPDSPAGIDGAQPPGVSTPQ